jgi:succinate dehydrogenase/fumarate reductase flavoprotein subunit
MAFRAGAELTGMEFCIGGSCHLSDGEHDLGSFNAILASLGGMILNARGERFMEKYAPVLKERANWQLLTQALAKEYLEGRSPAVWDLSTVKAEDIDYFERLHPDRAAPFKKAGIDLRKDRVLFISDVNVRSGSGPGGIKIDLEGKTNLPGLYAAGSVCKNRTGGTYTVPGLNLAFCCVSGHRAGLEAGRESGQAMLQEPDPKQVESLETQIYSPLKGEVGPTSDQVFRMVDELTKPIRFGIIKTEDGIRETIRAFEKLERDELPRITARDAHELVKANQARNYALCAKLVFLSALERKESRSQHYRADYPYTDNRDWLKWSIIKRQEGGEIGVTFEPVPLDRYPVKPPKREQVPCPVQL